MEQNSQLNDLLRWGIVNTPEGSDPSQTPQRDPNDLRVLQQALFNRPSEAQLLSQEMAVVKSPERKLEDRITAFDNFQMLLEKLDNSNNLTPLKLWDPLLAELENEEEEMRMMAAWCVSTAVQNNIKTQDELARLNALPKITQIALTDPAASVRKKAALSLSSAVRNCPEALEQVLPGLPASVKPTGDQKIEADDMDTINEIFKKLREQVA